jgi:hypothetical protein
MAQQWEYCQAIYSMVENSGYLTIWFLSTNQKETIEGNKLKKGTFHPAVAERISRMGVEGWELVSLMPHSQHSSLFSEAQMWFKRPKADA